MHTFNLIALAKGQEASNSWQIALIGVTLSNNNSKTHFPEEVMQHHPNFVLLFKADYHSKENKNRFLLFERLKKYQLLNRFATSICISRSRSPYSPRNTVLQIKSLSQTTAHFKNHIPTAEHFHHLHLIQE